MSPFRFHFPIRLAAKFCIAAVLFATMPQRLQAAFGLTDEGGDYQVDSGAGLVFKVNKSNGDIFSIRYREGAELQQPKRSSQIASGLGSGSNTVAGAVLGGNIVKVTIATGPDNGVAGSLTQYLIVRRGLNIIYMATFATEEPHVGELRWITRLDPTQFPRRPVPSDNEGSPGPIESKDIFGHPGGTSTSKYYGDDKTHGKDRAMDLTYCGVSGTRVGVWMVFGNRESSSGGPFHRDIENQSTEVYNYMNSGHNMTEPPRLNVLHGPYAVVFTDGQPPQLPLDFTWIDHAGLDLKGYVPAMERGTVEGTAAGIVPGIQGVVGFSNAEAQYWAVAGENGEYTSPLMKPGSYDVKLYQGELRVATGNVTVTAGNRTRLDLQAPPPPRPIFKIGQWDGTPAGFLNGDKIVMMHPSDSRMAPWGPVTFQAGVDPDNTFPALQMRGVNNPTTIRFQLNSSQITDHTLRIGITCAYAAGRPQIKVNNLWTPPVLAPPSRQPKSRSFTIGTYRGNNALYTFKIPASAFVRGTNTITISAESGNHDLGKWLSAGWVYDAVQLDAAD